MFDIGFWELLLIAVLSLFVVGPERLPGFIRETTRKLSDIRRFIYHSKKEIEHQLDLHEQRELSEKISDVDELLKNAPDKVAKSIIGDDEETSSLSSDKRSS